MSKIEDEIFGDGELNGDSIIYVTRADGEDGDEWWMANTESPEDAVAEMIVGTKQRADGPFEREDVLRVTKTRAADLAEVIGSSGALINIERQGERITDVDLEEARGLSWAKEEDEVNNRLRVLNEKLSQLKGRTGLSHKEKYQRLKDTCLPGREGELTEEFLRSIGAEERASRTAFIVWFEKYGVLGAPGERWSLISIEDGEEVTSELTDLPLGRLLRRMRSNSSIDRPVWL